MSDRHDFINNPWQRLPGVILISLLIHGAMIWGLGFLLVPLQPPLAKPIYAQLIEVKPPTSIPTPPPAVTTKPPPPIPKSELKHQTKRILRHEPTARASTPSSPVAAYEAVIKWHFIPARQADTAVEEWVQIPIVFRLNQKN
ncbi:MAG: energy transducer TonB [Nitrospirae bacterium]|nr:energy transducer TonB [Nitrospirota bacterium]